MDRLRKVDTMSPWQLGIILIMMGVGASIITSSQTLYPTAGQQAWLVPLVAGGMYFGAAYLMIKLGDMFPGETFPVYLRRIWGQRVAILLIWLLILASLVRLFVGIQTFAREITFFMFDRTPVEVIILTLLGVAAYCAIQDLGTVLKMVQILFFSALPMLLGIILVGYINFEFINIYPFWPINIAGFIKAFQESWELFFGYEFILWLLPAVYRGKSSVAKTVGIAFLLKGMLMAIAMLMTLGGLTLEGVLATTYPTSVSIRGVELPGTFVERMDNYMFLVWIPLAFCAQAIAMFILAQIMAETHGYRDHKPFVLLLIPILFVGGMSLHDMPTFAIISCNTHWLGLLFSFVIIPATYLLAKRRQKQNQKAAVS